MFSSSNIIELFNFYQSGLKVSLRLSQYLLSLFKGVFSFKRNYSAKERFELVAFFLAVVAIKSKGRMNLARQKLGLPRS